MNWYKKIKLSRRGTDRPLMDQYVDKEIQNPYIQDYNTLVNHAPFLGGNERDGYPRDIQFNKEKSDNEKIRGHLPTENVLMDQDPPTGEGAGNSDLTERFSDPVDKLKNFDKEKDPEGPFNMTHQTRSKNVFKNVSKKSKIKGLSIM